MGSRLFTANTALFDVDRLAAVILSKDHQSDTNIGSIAPSVHLFSV